MPSAFGGRTGEYLRVLPMYFYRSCIINYTMQKIKKPKLKRALSFVVLAAIIIAAVAVLVPKSKSAAADKSQMTALTVWQIDSFEGGKGSRAGYLKTVGESFSASSGCYLTVTSLTADAARENLERGTIPDMISYGAGEYGFESYFTGDTPFYSWCNGGYCLLTVDESADFSDVTNENCIINQGNNNFYEVCAVLCGIGGAESDKATSAYVKLLNGKCKYLLGTQRDIFRLRTRGAAYKFKPVTEFNDLYQNISVTSTQSKKAALSEKFIKYLFEKSNDISKLGLFSEGNALYEDDLHVMENLTFEYRLVAPCSKATVDEILRAASNNDAKKLKSILK